MYPANEIVAVHIAVCHQRAAVGAAAIQHGYLVIEAHDDQVDGPDKGINGLPIGQLVPGHQGRLFHKDFIFYQAVTWLL